MQRTHLILLAALFAMLLTTSCDQAGKKDGKASPEEESA